MASSGKQGFASMDPAKQRAIASLGGKSIDPAKRSFSQDRELAARAGRKGGQGVRAQDRSFSKNRELAARAGRKGGKALPASERSFSKDPKLAARAGRQGGLNRVASATAQAALARNEERAPLAEEAAAEGFDPHWGSEDG